MIENQKWKIEINKKGYLSGLYRKADPYEMNWVIENAYLEAAGYETEKRLFGQFDLTVDGKTTESSSLIPKVYEKKEAQTAAAVYDCGDVAVEVEYDLAKNAEQLSWKLCMRNQTYGQ